MTSLRLVGSIDEPAPPVSKPPPSLRTPYTACPLCESKNIARLRTGDCTKHPLYRPELPPLVQWMQCADCTHVFVDGPFTPAALALLFEKTLSSQIPGADMEAQRFNSARRVGRVLDYFGSIWFGAGRPRWLDVGFGNGSLLFTAQEFGFHPVGLEARPQSIKAMADFGVEARADVAVPPHYAVVSMCDVLEHMEHPKQALQEARGWLIDGGALLVSMPNMDTALWRAWDKAGVNPYWGELEHAHNFTRERLFSLLVETRFLPVRYAVSEMYRGCMEVIARTA